LNNDQLALRALELNRVAVFVVAYNAERHIEQTLRRIPSWVAEKLAEVYVIDDCSTDNTISIIEKMAWPEAHAPLRVFRTPVNRGYGGNQKLGYLYAIESGFDIVVLLHGDGQYAPESLPSILAPYAEGAGAAFGSRFLIRGDAREGGMPLYKLIGNRVLTKAQNVMLNTRMSETHCGYRSYRVSTLKSIPFTENSDDFGFDAEIIAQLAAFGFNIVEVAVPTFYGDEVCHVNVVGYARQCVMTALKFRLNKWGILSDRRFDLGWSQSNRQAVLSKGLIVDGKRR